MAYYQLKDETGEPMEGTSCEVFYLAEGEWYWQACFPGRLPDGEPVGPFDTEREAREDAGC